MIVYLWSAGENTGISDQGEAARLAAAKCLTSGAAGDAHVVQASSALAVPTLMDAYMPTGAAWVGRRTGSGVAWTPLLEAVSA